MKNLNMTEEQTVQVFIAECEKLLASWRGKGHGAAHHLISSSLLAFYDTLNQIKLQVAASLEEKKAKALAPEQTDSSTPVYLTVRQFSQKHPWPNQNGLRALIYAADTNGFNRVIRRAGSRILIKEDEFFKWLDDQKS